MCGNGRRDMFKGLMFVGILATVLTACAGSESDTSASDFGMSGGMGSAGGDSGSGGNGGGTSCGCPAPDTYPKAGTRLSPVMFTTADGAKAHYREQWIDSDFGGTVCTFVDLPSGETRCLPEHDTSNNYSDDKCQVPVIYTLSCGLLPSFVRIDTAYGANSCGYLYNSALYTPGSEVLPKISTLYRKTGIDGCEAYFTVPSAGHVYNLDLAPPINTFATPVLP